MRQLLFATLLAVSGTTPALAGEMFSGTHTYRPVSETWLPVPASGWRTVTMVGDYTPISGPIPAGHIECRGTNYWTRSDAEADGVCVFGEAPDVWMLRYRMVNTDRAARTAEQFKRLGEWTVVGGTGRYDGMTGSGTYLAEGETGGDGKYQTRWEGEVDIPE